MADGVRSGWAPIWASPSRVTGEPVEGDEPGTIHVCVMSRVEALATRLEADGTPVRSTARERS